MAAEGSVMQHAGEMVSIGSFVFSAIISILGFLIKRDIGQLDSQLESLTESTETISQQIHGLDNRMVILEANRLTWDRQPGCLAKVNDRLTKLEAEHKMRHRD